jgi:endonuclease G
MTPISEPELDAKTAAEIAEARKDARARDAAPAPDRDELARRAYRVAAAGGASKSDFERILGTNDLVGIEFLARGVRAARSVARIHIRTRDGQGFATGFMVAPRLLLTNHHVFGHADDARDSQVEFGYEIPPDGGRPRAGTLFRCAPDALFIAHQALDFALVALEETPINGSLPLAAFGWLRIDPVPGKVEELEWVNLIQHPNGDPKQVALRENQLLRKTATTLQYASDTVPGSSGAPCLNDVWQVVALHSRSRRGKGDRYVANEGIRISQVIKALRARPEAATDPLMKAFFADMEAGGGPFGGDTAFESASAPAAGDGLAALEAMLENLVERLGGEFISPEAKRRARRRPAAPAGDTLRDRKGYDPAFLGGAAIAMPEITAEARRFGEPSRNRQTGRQELPYTHFSVVMCSDRRLAFVTAVNIDGRKSVPLDRGRDTWRFDPRIAASDQADDALYKETGENFFDRGHLVRRLDPCWGSAATVQQANDDTFYWTNCSPQHWSFNQGETMWNGLENYILQNTDAENIRCTVFTGPVFRADDYEHRGVQIPNDYYKVVVLRTRTGRLLASGYTVSQARLVRMIDFEALPVGQFRTFQRPIARIVALTGLRFPAEVMAADVLTGRGPADDARELVRLSDIALPAD